MTCIAAVTDGKTVWMGGDSAGVCGWDMDVRRDPKVFRNGEYLIGFTSSFRMGQLLAHRFRPPEAAPKAHLHSFMVTDFIDAVRECLKNGGYAEREKDRESGGTFLVGLRGRLFQVDCDYQVGESVTDYAAVGCGHAYAKGSLYSTGDLRAPADRIIMALEAAARHSAGVRGPFKILSTENIA
jgi:hypothetical protein